MVTTAARLEQLHHEKLGDCRRYGLHEGRTNLVFGEGDPDARIMFVGEGPGAHEDHLGRPFVGDSGVILNNILLHSGLVREEVYIANVVKCRPPGNRDPEPGEITACLPFLQAQIAIVRPTLLVALGRFAGNVLTQQRPNLSAEALQDRIWTYEHAALGQSIPVICLYHPAYLHRNLKTEEIKTLYPETVSRLRRAIALSKPLNLGF